MTAPAVLYLVHRLPYPPNKGDKIRSYHLLRYLARHYRVFLGTFVDDPEDRQYVSAVEALCEQVHVVELSSTWAKVLSVRGLLAGTALSIPFYRDHGLAMWVKRIAEQEDIRRVIAFSSTMAQYLFDQRLRGARRVVDFVDVDSDKWRQYAPTRPWPMRWVYGREGQKLLDFEREVIASCDAGVFVSEREAALFRELAPVFGDKITHVNNGVDLEYFSPHQKFANPYPEGVQPVLFVGAMDYWPNIDAVTWFADEIFPVVRARRPSAHFFIVGGNATPRVKELAGRTSISVAGRVDDVRPYLAHATVVVAPLRIARGVQNKVLESMAAARPTVVTPAALEGIDAVPGNEVLVADDATTFADRVGEVIDGKVDGLALGLMARERVERAYDWDSNLASFRRLLEGECDPPEAIYGVVNG